MSNISHSSQSISAASNNLRTLYKNSIKRARPDFGLQALGISGAALSLVTPSLMDQIENKFQYPCEKNRNAICEISRDKLDIKNFKDLEKISPAATNILETLKRLNSFFPNWYSKETNTPKFKHLSENIKSLPENLEKL